MTLSEIVNEAKEGQEFAKDRDQSVILSFQNGILLDQTMNPPVLRREDFEADDWSFLE